MRRLLKAVEAMDQELSNAEKYLDCAIKAREDDQELYATYLKIAENESQNAELIHSTIVKLVDKYKSEHTEIPEAMKEMWAWKHERYIEDYAKFKHKLEATKRIAY